MSAKISESLRAACYGLHGFGSRAGFPDYPNKRTTAALIRRGLARCVPPGEGVLILTEEGRKIASDYNDMLMRLGQETKS